MKNISMEEMRELFKKSVIQVFDDRYRNCDAIDTIELSYLLHSHNIEFYYSVSLIFIHKYLEKIMEK